MSTLSLCKVRRKYFKDRAWQSMGRSGNLLKLFGAFFFSFLICEAGVCLIESTAVFLPEGAYPFLFLAELIFLFFAASPLILGICFMAYRMCRGEKADISMLFYAFKNHLASAYSVSFIMLLGIALMCAVSFPIARVIAYIIEGLDSEIFSALAVGISIALTPLVSGAFGWTLLMPVAFFKTGSGRAAFKLAREKSKKTALELSAFNVSFIPFALLSVLPFWIAFFVFFIPFYVTASMSCSLYLIETEQ